MDFVRKAVRAIGRCAIKVEVSGSDISFFVYMREVCHGNAV